MEKEYHCKFKEFLKKEKLKFTPERKHILDIVFSMHQHFDVEDIYNKHKNISKATLYRTLPLLVNSGLVKETVGLEGRTSYEHIFGHSHHDHLLCIDCGKIIEFKEPKLEKLQNVVCEKYRFQPVDHRLGIKGHCKNCWK